MGRGRCARLEGALLMALMLGGAAGAWSGLSAQAKSEASESAATQAPTEYWIGQATGPVTLDALLDEEAWSRAVAIPLPFEVSPGDNAAAPVVTQCRLIYDADHLYLGCTAEDPSPDAIRAYVVERDQIDGHDRIVLTVDPFHDQRRAFQFGVSALGVQSDAVLAQQGAMSPDQGPAAMALDASWDAIWRSAGRITDDGYVVEAAIPFRSLRFPRPNGEDATWGIYLSRLWPRGSIVETRSAAWDRSDGCLLCQANTARGLSGISPGAGVQLAPTLTASRTTRRDGAEAPLVTEPLDGAAGLDAQWSVTSDLTLDLTANPDFSQVEADVAQLDVNTRFALFFPERRPFFLEGADFFATPIQAVFTRSIADPTAGAKLTGKLGPNAVGLLLARDRGNQLLLPGSQSSAAATASGGATTTIARFRRDLGGSSTVGALVTAREGDGYHNRVGGLDAFYRPAASMTVEAQLLRSDTEYPAAIAAQHAQPTGAFSGHAALLRTRWETRSWSLFGQARLVEPEFRADAGFLSQAGVRGGNANIVRRWWGDRESWFTDLRLEAGVWRTETLDADPLHGGFWFGLGYGGPGQSSFGVFPNVFMHEHFAGTTYEGMTQVWFDLRAAPSGGLSLGVNGMVGDAVDVANERLGVEVRLSPFVTTRLGRHLEVTIQHTHQQLDHEGARVHTATLSQLRTVYNFSPRSYVRAIAQYRRVDRDTARYTDPVDRRSTSLLTQLLYAYELSPQTVFFLGYAEDGAGHVGVDDVRTPLTTRGRTLFVKLGYAWRP